MSVSPTTSRGDRVSMADRFVLRKMTGQSGLACVQARAVEQAMIGRNPGFENARNSINPSPTYRDAADSGPSVRSGRKQARGPGRPGDKAGTSGRAREEGHGGLASDG